MILCIALAAEIPCDSALLKNKLRNENISDERILEYIDNCHHDPDNLFFKNATFDSIELSRPTVFKSLSAKHQFDINMKLRKEGMNESLLTWAAKSNQEEVIRLLVELGFDVNEPADHGITALHRSAKHRNNGISRYLLELGAMYDARDEWGHSALYFAIIYENESLTNLLLDDYSALINNHEKDFEILLLVISKGNMKLLKRLVENEIFDLNFKKKDTHSLLELAMFLEMLKQLDIYCEKRPCFSLRMARRRRFLLLSAKIILEWSNFLLKNLVKILMLEIMKARRPFCVVLKWDVQWKLLNILSQKEQI